MPHSIMFCLTRLSVVALCCAPVLLSGCVHYLTWPGETIAGAGAADDDLSQRVTATVGGGTDAESVDSHVKNRDANGAGAKDANAAQNLAAEVMSDYINELRRLPASERQQTLEALMALTAASNPRISRAQEHLPDTNPAGSQAGTGRRTPPGSAAEDRQVARSGRLDAVDEGIGERRAVSRASAEVDAVRSERTSERSVEVDAAGQDRVPSLAGNRKTQPYASSSRRDTPPADPPSSDSTSSDSTSSERKRKPSHVDWHASLQRAIGDLQRELAEAPQEHQLAESELARREILLRMLQVAAGDTDGAMSKFEHITGREAEFWRNELFGLHLGVQENRTPVVSQRAARMLEHLRKATSELAAVSTLDLRNAAFCKNVHGYADVESFRPYRFEADQEVLLYVEIENFAAEPISVASERGASEGAGNRFETEFRGTYQILDGERRRVADQKLPLDKQQCRNHRRDYYIAYRIYMPRNIAPGPYTLELTLEDVKGQKFGQAFLDFEITR